MTRKLFTLAVGALLGAAGVARADILLTTDGRIIDGPGMERNESHVVIHFENGDVQVPLEMVQDVFIAAELENLPRRERSRIQRRLKERREQIEDALAHSEWGNAYEETTKNFRWKYTLPKHIAEQFQARLESYYETFSKEWKVKRDRKKQKLMINFFSNMREFHRTGGAGRGALAYFMFVGDYDLCCFYDRLDFEFTEMVLYHEASHYMQQLINERFLMPLWPSEGMAEYYGGALWNEEKKRLDVGLIQDGRLTEVKNDISLDKFLTIAEIVEVPAGTDYTWGWALVHFFMNHPKYRKGFMKYVDGLANAKGVKRVPGPAGLRTVTGKESLRYLMEVLKIKDTEQLAALDREFHLYVQEDLQVTTAGGLQKAAKGAIQAGKRLRAKRLFEEADEAGGLTANGCYQYAKLVRAKDKGHARELYERATELDPLTGTYWYEYARLLEDEERAEKLKALARELDPEVGFYDIDLEDTDEDEEEDE